MKIPKIRVLSNSSEIFNNPIYIQAKKQVENAIQQVDWPLGTGTFSIYPESGKKKGEGNGVKPIKDNFIKDLEEQGWSPELSIISGLGKSDAVLKTQGKIVAVAEWETGNVSSSHRSLNKMAFAIQQQLIIAGFLIVPCRNLARYLTDRIGNYEELEPYFDFWFNSIASLSYPAVIVILGIEQDEDSLLVPRIPKGTDGLANN
ncbi:MAG: restriction endonuclease [Planktothrix sp.]|uniref:restriction endonuclease n=1 Tax=Planktothrix sp. TaxID=3088171 RepID=UPI0038D3FDD4